MASSTPVIARGLRRHEAARQLRAVPPEVLVFVLGAVARLLLILRSAGLHGFFGYDAAVYFAGADAFLHGRLPYRDFVLLHPPGLMLTLTPFAWLTRFMSDETAFTIGCLCFAVLGALNAVLVVRVARALGWTTTAATIGGLFYALWYAAVGSEYLTKLEPLGNALFLSALLLAVRAQRSRRLWLGAASGFALGAALSVKIWWIVPLACVLLWHTWRQRRVQDGAAVMAGILIGVAVIDLPFFLVAPDTMWHSVVLEQLGRASSRVTTLGRLSDISGLTRLHKYLPAPMFVAAGCAFVVLAGAILWRAWQVTRGRFVVVVLAAQLVVLLIAPSWFSFYSDYLAAAASLTVGAAAMARVARGRDAGRRSRAAAAEAFGWIPVAVVAVVTATVLVVGHAGVRAVPGAQQLARAVSHVRCVMSDSPMGQIEVDALSRGLAAGCPDWIDVTGRTYGPDQASNHGITRVRNTRWQHDLLRYLRAGQSVIIVRRAGTGISPRVLRAIARDGVLARAGGSVIYRVRH